MSWSCISIPAGPAGLVPAPAGRKLVPAGEPHSLIGVLASDLVADYCNKFAPRMDYPDGELVSENRCTS